MRAEQKQIVRVLEAARSGYATSQEISEAIGLSVATVSSYLSVLAEEGLVRRAYRNRVRYGMKGPYSHWYEAA